MAIPVLAILTACVLGGGQQAPVVIMQGTPHEVHATVRVAPGGAADKHVQDVIISHAPESGRWIGVRVASIPPALAAHIGSDGVMIENVAKDSPADKQGLDRYDIVQSFNGQKIASMEDLYAAVGGAPEDKPSQLVVVRKGKTETLSITPAERPAGPWSFKYEPDEAVQLRGQRLRMAPGAGWILEELGPMHKLPDVLKELNNMDLNLQVLPDLEDADVHIIDDRDAGQPDADQDARIELKIKISDDGQTTSVERNADGKFTVEKVSPSGEKSSAQYDNEEAFRAGDPDAYKIYSRHSGPGGRTWLHIRPPTEDLEKLQKHFQIEIERKLKAATEKANEAADKARDAMDKAGQEMRRHQMIIEKSRSGAPTATPSPDDLPAPPLAAPKAVAPQVGSLSISIEDSGAITITTRSGDQRKVYKFDNKEELKKSEPALYERVKDLLE